MCKWHTLDLVDNGTQPVKRKTVVQDLGGFPVTGTPVGPQDCSLNSGKAMGRLIDLQFGNKKCTVT